MAFSNFNNNFRPVRLAPMLAAMSLISALTWAEISQRPNPNELYLGPPEAAGFRAKLFRWPGPNSNELGQLDGSGYPAGAGLVPPPPGPLIRQPAGLRLLRTSQLATWVEPPADFTPIIYDQDRQRRPVDEAAEQVAPAAAEPAGSRPSRAVPADESDAAAGSGLGDSGSAGAAAASELKPSVGRWSEWHDMSVEPDLASSESEAPLYRAAPVGATKGAPLTPIRAQQQQQQQQQWMTKGGPLQDGQQLRLHVLQSSRVAPQQQQPQWHQYQAPVGVAMALASAQGLKTSSGQQQQEAARKFPVKRTRQIHLLQQQQHSSNAEAQIRQLAAKDESTRQRTQQQPGSNWINAHNNNHHPHHHHDQQQPPPMRQQPNAHHHHHHQKQPVHKRSSPQPASSNVNTTTTTAAPTKVKVNKRRPVLVSNQPVGLTSWILGGIRDLDGRHWHLPDEVIDRLIVNDIDLIPSDNEGDTETSSPAAGSGQSTASTKPEKEASRPAITRVSAVASMGGGSSPTISQRMPR